MIIGKVVGSVFATRKNENLTGNKFLIVEPSEKWGFGTHGRIVAIDHIGAGVDEIVLVALGSAARVCCGNEQAPVDAMVVGIVDSP